MTAPLWSAERLISLCSHRDNAVRGWAASRLSALFPDEAAPTMMRLSRDPDEHVALVGAGHFCDHPGEGDGDELLAVFKKASGRVAARLCKALAVMGEPRLLEAAKEKLAAEFGDDPIGCALILTGVAFLRTASTQEFVEASLAHLPSLPFRKEFASSFFTANLVAGTDIEKLVRFCAENDAEETLAPLLFEILSKCGFWISKEDLTVKARRGSGSKDHPLIVQDSLEVLDEFGYSAPAETIGKLFEKRRYLDVVRECQRVATTIVDERRAACPESDMRGWEEKKEMPSLNIALLSALDARAEEMPKGVRETIARAALAAVAGLSQLQSLIGVDPASLSSEVALALFLEDRPPVPQDRVIVNLLASDAAIDDIIDRCRKELQERAYSDASPRILEFLGGFIDEEMARELLAMDFAGEEIDDAICAAVRKLGSSAIPLLRPLMENGDGENAPLALQILEDLPFEASADLVLAHWSSLWEKQKDGLLDVVEYLGDKRFIAPLRKELREGEPFEGALFRLLCLIHGVSDPEIKRIEKEDKERRRRQKRAADAIKTGDYNYLFSEPLEVALRCRGCHRLYHYRVRNVQVGLESEDLIISDLITCKNCGALDHYETTADLTIAVSTRLALLNALPDDAEPDFGGSTIVPVKMASAMGDGLSSKDVLAKYEKRLAKEPDNPELLLGYANSLRMAKRMEEAVPFYNKTVERDPLAVEALGSLGDYAFYKGDMELAFARYNKAAEVMDDANYYRTTLDVDGFKEAILDRLATASERLGREPPLSIRAVAPTTGQTAGGLKIGRNDPCPCGSGKKYKKCCLLKESGDQKADGSPPPPKPVVDPIYENVRKKLDAFDHRSARREDFLEAVALYWDTEPREPLQLPEEAAEDQGEFHEWFMTDFRPESGKTVMERFLDEAGDRLSERERAIVEALSGSHCSVYEVQTIREGTGLTIKDVFTGQEMDVAEVSGSYSVAPWDLVLFRVYTVDGVNRFSGNGRVLPRKRLKELVAYLDGARQDAGGTTWAEFLKERPFLVDRFFNSLVEERPVFLTEERHLVIASKAHFAVSNYDRARNALLRQYDFGDPEELRPKGVRVSWLKRGPSKEWRMGTEEIENAIITSSQMIHPSGRLDWTVLGTVTLHPDKLTLECMSRERLERGKQRLMTLMGSFIRHRADEFQDIEVGMERAAQRREPKKAPVPDERAQALAASVMKQHMAAWPDQKLPALAGKSPREAVQTREGREKVLDLIKGFENTEGRKKAKGEPYIDLAFLRTELGL